MRYVDLKDIRDTQQAIALMQEGWEMASASYDQSFQRWRYLLGKPLILGLDYDPESGTYEESDGTRST